MCGKNDNFERPAIILRKNDKESALVLPITSSIRERTYYFNINISDTPRNILLNQARTISRKRMLRRIKTVSENKFKAIYNAYLNYLNTL